MEVLTVGEIRTDDDVAMLQLCEDMEQFLEIVTLEIPFEESTSRCV